MTSLDLELARERAHHDACRAALARMTEDVAGQVVTGEDTAASGADAEALGRHLRSRAKELREQPPGPLFFGRLDREDGQVHHIGRRRIAEDHAAPPLVVDWRAPVSRAYYQAGAHDPQGVLRRRRFGWAPYGAGASEDLTAFEDERLTAGGEVTVSALLAGEIERPRVGPMRDIAATIQPEQDDLVRSDPAASLCVQGAPGTGKTAVGLHRAAYLLYTHPQRIRRSGLLVLGPHRAFLAYISEVLPSLGESGVRQATLGDEIARHPVRAEDGETAARTKHDPRMAGVLHRALYGRVDPAPAEDLAVPDGSSHWRLPAARLAGIVREVREEAPPYATGRERVRARVVRDLQLRAERRWGPMGAAWARRIERARALTAFLDACWPRTTPEEVLAAFLADPADPALTEEERAALRWERPPRSYRSARWTAADLVLLDELAGLIERPEGYGHVVVDEAQDLSPMECRAVARRTGFGSLTVLGDLAQGTTPWAATDWHEHLAHLGKPGAPVVSLTLGYRVPAAIVDLANRLLPKLGADVPAGRSVRRDGEVTIHRTTDLDTATREAVRAALAEEGSVGVITSDTLLGRIAEAATEAASPDEAARLTVLPARAVKGLEFDHVVVVEPAAITDSEQRGLNRLYVVLTRAVSRLTLVHERDLPEGVG
ncbi:MULTISPECIES: HelD family protein [unclassified Streptomyces]|uniref:HelD family protein n=1 Tax=unclassified Streptomyces TaxID=2593676 RepID=UPI0016617254|nr:MULTISPECIES: ATP-binding domain-containing protein [unclassified Streptomyces]MBD0712435.1 AAA family ATPase [Streptomyces sp. CBMA291]MBD0716809.1 AAA family ATPase [Streptomyces sp. CBMA370]